MPVPPPDIGLGDAGHLNGGLHADLNAALLQTVGQSEAVDDRGKHAHLVGAGALHPVAAVLDATPEIAAADHNRNLRSLICNLFHLFGNLQTSCLIKAKILVSGQRFAA